MTMKLISLVISACVLACSPTLCQTVTLARGDQQLWPCGTTSNLLVDSSRQPVWIDSDELKKHAIEMPSPNVPSSLRAAGRVRVSVLISSDGHVKCVQVLNGHPILRRAVAEAAEKWTFKPFVADDKPVAVFGHLVFAFK
jgi:TonB family protein